MSDGVFTGIQEAQPRFQQSRRHFREVQVEDYSRPPSECSGLAAKHQERRGYVCQAIRKRSLIRLFRIVYMI